MTKQERAEKREKLAVMIYDLLYGTNYSKCEGDKNVSKN